MQHRVARCCAQRRVLPLQTPQRYLWSWCRGAPTSRCLRGSAQQLGQPGESAPARPGLGGHENTLHHPTSGCSPAPLPSLTNPMGSFCLFWEICNVISRTAVLQASLRREGQRGAGGVQGSTSPTGTRQRAFNWGEIYSKPNGLIEGCTSSHCSAIAQTHASNLTAESPPWRFVWLKPPSEPAGFCSFPVSINESTVLAIEDTRVSDSVSHLCRGNRHTRTILERLWKLCTYIIRAPVGENTSPSSFLQSLIRMLPETDVCCNYY